MTQTATRTNGHKTPPHNIDAEEAVLGCCLLGQEALAWATGTLTVDDFYRPAHRIVFELLAELHRDGQSVDAKVVMSALGERGSLTDVGGASFVAFLAGLDVTAANVGYFGRQVLATSRLRKLIDFGLKVSQVGYEEPDPDRAVALARSLLDELEQGTAVPLAGPVEILHAMLEAKEEEENGNRVLWNLRDLDRLTAGLGPRKLIVLAARPGVGKSSLALQVALEAAKGRRALFGSYEMGLAEIGQHHLAALGHVSIDQALMEVDADRLADAREEYQRRDFRVLDGNPDLERFTAQVVGLHARQPFDLIVVDYLQLVPAKLGKGSTREQEVAAVSRALKRLAVRLNVPVLALASVNRDADGQMPTLRHLRDSGAIEADADQVVFLQEQPPETDDERRQRETEEWRIVDAEVAKSRMGKVGRVSLHFDEPRTTFSDMAPGWLAARDPSGAGA